MAVSMNQNSNTLVFWMILCSSSMTRFTSVSWNSLLEKLMQSSLQVRFTSDSSARMRPYPLASLKPQLRLSISRCYRLATPLVSSTTPSSPTQFSQKLRLRVTRFGNLYKRSLVISAPLPPTRLMPHLKTNSFSCGRCVRPLTMYLKPRYPKFLEATPRLSDSTLCSLLRRVPSVFAPQFLMQLKSKFRLRVLKLSVLISSILSQMACVPTSVTLLKQRSSPRVCKFFCVLIAFATISAPSAPILLAYKLRSSTLRLALCRCVSRKPSDFAVKPLPISTKEQLSKRYPNLPNLRQSSATVSFLMERMRDSLSFLRELRLLSLLANTLPSSRSAQIESKAMSSSSTPLGMRESTQSAPLVPIGLLARLILIDLYCLN